jgi:hypothetical protein
MEWQARNFRSNQQSIFEKQNFDGYAQHQIANLVVGYIRMPAVLQVRVAQRALCLKHAA